VLGTAVYTPFKATFWIRGDITSGFTFPFAGADTADRVATAGCGGTWAITPGDHFFLSTDSCLAGQRQALESGISSGILEHQGLPDQILIGD
jgi:hypothetical protein